MVTTDINRRIWLDGEGASFEIGPDADGLDLVRLRTPDQVSIEYWGKVDITIEAVMARALGNALIAAANEADAALSRSLTK